MKVWISNRNGLRLDEVCGWIRIGGSDLECWIEAGIGIGNAIGNEGWDGVWDCDENGIKVELVMI